MRDLQPGLLLALQPGEYLCGLPGLMKFIALGAVSVFAAMLVLELAVGCGQVTYFPDRTWRSNECVFISSEIVYGQW